MLILPMVAAWLGSASGDRGVTLILALINTTIYGVVARNPLHRSFAVPLALASVLTSGISLPSDWSRVVFARIPWEPGFAQAFVAFLVAGCLLTKRVPLGLVGAATVSLVAMTTIPPPGKAMDWAIQLGLAYLLVHGLRWDPRRDPYAVRLRALAAAAWFIHASIWTLRGAPSAQMATLASVVVALAFVSAWLLKAWPPPDVVIAAGLVATTGPVWGLFGWIAAIPKGLIAIADSFFLLAVGTLTALTKHRWHPVSDCGASRPIETL